jgi:hypothetical protein
MTDSTRGVKAERRWETRVEERQGWKGEILRVEFGYITGRSMYGRDSRIHATT